MPDYAAARRTFSWAAAAARLDGLPGGRGLNIAHEAVDRHVAAGRGDRHALRLLDTDGHGHPVTYAELRRRTNRFAQALERVGVRPGERVFTLLPRREELWIAVLGALKARCVVSPLFSAFGPEPVAQRLRLGRGAVLVTTPRLYARSVADACDALPALRHVLVTGDGAAPPGTSSLEEQLAGEDGEFVIGPTRPEDPALLHYTSGTTGTPKGALHVHRAVVAHHATAESALDLGADDVFWCTADPGWVTGASYGIVAPLAHGATAVVDPGDFDAQRWYRVLAEQRVTVWYTAPTTLRMLARHGAPPPGCDLGALRHVASVGEPLDAATVRWSDAALGTPAHDTWWQTETGAIMIANYAADPVRPGAMGRPVPGIEATVLQRDAEGRVRRDDGHVHEVDAPGTEGELALRTGWPSMFRGYLDAPEREAAVFADGWYLTGDVVRRDADGWYWFVGRSDDVIKTAGQLVGPFEVEGVVMAHPAAARNRRRRRPADRLSELTRPPAGGGTASGAPPGRGR
jgi:acetyl-CoA synthetase